MAKSDLNSDAYVAEHGEAACRAGGGIFFIHWYRVDCSRSCWFGKVAKSVPSQFDLVSWGCSLGLGFSCAEWILCTFKVLKQLVIDSV
jgi:hypothetical protein